MIIKELLFNVQLTSVDTKVMWVSFELSGIKMTINLSKIFVLHLSLIPSSIKQKKALFFNPNYNTKVCFCCLSCT